MSTRFAAPALCILLAAGAIAGVPDEPSGRLGVNVRLENGNLVVYNLEKGSPAEGAGLQRGDVIVQVNDFSTAGATIDQSMEHLRGPAGAPVRLTISRASRVLTLTVVRDEMPKERQYFNRALEFASQGNFTEAAPLARRSAEMGYAEAQNYLGWMLQNGKGVAPDLKEARQWYRKAAEQKHPYAADHLGWMFQYGVGGDQDFKEAMKWYRIALDQNLDWSQYNVCLMYANGQGVKQDFAQAARYCALSANQGNVEAQTQLGYMYLNGHGVPQDYRECHKWSMKASEKGSMAAPYNLGILYENGWGVKRDLAESIRWFRLSAERGLPLGREKMKNIPSFNISGSDVQPAQAQAGGMLRLGMTLEISGIPAGQAQPVRIVRELFIDGRPLLSHPILETQNLGAGRHSNTFEFRLPKSAKPGTYVCRVTAASLGLESSREAVFLVR